MKNYLSKATAIMTMLSIAFMFAPTVDARVNNNDQVFALSQVQDNVMARLVLNANTTATSTVLVDLSDTTTFKHFNSTGAIEVSEILISYYSAVVSTTTLKFGVISSTTPSGALSDVFWFDEITYATTGATSTNTNDFNSGRISLGYEPSVMKLDVASGFPTKFISSDVSTSSSLYATTTAYRSPKNAGYGTVPGVGDLVMRVYSQQGTATTSVSVLYRVK